MILCAVSRFWYLLKPCPCRNSLCIPWNHAHRHPSVWTFLGLFTLMGPSIGPCSLRHFLGISWPRTRWSLLPACALWFVMWFGHEASLPSQKRTWQSYDEGTLESQLEISPLGSGHWGWPIPDLLLSLSASWLPRGEQPTPPHPLPGCSASPQT